jgi:hypothetical protein
LGEKNIKMDFSVRNVEDWRWIKLAQETRGVDALVSVPQDEYM